MCLIALSLFKKSKWKSAENNFSEMMLTKTGRERFLLCEEILREVVMMAMD